MNREYRGVTVNKLILASGLLLTSSLFTENPPLP